MFVMKSMTGEGTARELINVLSVSLSIPTNCLLAAMQDGASVNNVAMRTLSVIYPYVFDVRCVSHTLDLVGGKFIFPVLVSFIVSWIALFSHSHKAKAMWKQHTGRSMASYNKTRWWSSWEVMHQ